MFNSISNDEQAVQEMLMSIYCYWKVLIKRFMDYAALSLRAGCVFDVCPGIRERLRSIPSEQCDFVDSYLAEDVYIRTKRKKLQQTKERLEKVDAILGGHSVTRIGNDAINDMMTRDDNASMTLDALAKRFSSTDDSDTTVDSSISRSTVLTS